MKKLGSKKLVVIPVLAVLCLALAPAIVAAAGGMPAAHGVCGKDFGDMVSDLAQTGPGAVAAHVGECDPEVDGMGGMPAVHGVTGKEFGALVSALAKSEPGAVAAHVTDNCCPELEAPEATIGDCIPEGGIPAVHGLSGQDFGAAASTLAKSAPGAVADHIGVPAPCE